MGKTHLYFLPVGPLTQDLNKNIAMGLARGKNDVIDAARIAEDAHRYGDKAVRYAIPNAALSSMKNLLSDREFLLIDKKRYQSQLSDQKRYISPEDFNHKSKRWGDVIRSIDKHIQVIDAEIDAIITADPVLKRQKDLLISIDGVGERIVVNMIAVTCGFTRFKNARQFCGFAGLAPYKYDSGASVRSKTKDFQTSQSDDEDTHPFERSECCYAYERRRIQGLLRTQT